MLFHPYQLENLGGTLLNLTPFPFVTLFLVLNVKENFKIPKVSLKKSQGIRQTQICIKH